MLFLGYCKGSELKLSYPFILAISSIRSSSIVISDLQYGISTFCVKFVSFVFDAEALNPRLFNIFAVSFLVMLSPIIFLYLWPVKFCFLLGFIFILFEYKSQFPLMIISFLLILLINAIALFNAIIDNSIGTPLSNLWEASVFNPSSLDDCLMLDISKQADSKNIFFVFESISELKPPIIPANPIDWVPSVILSILEFNSLFSPSNDLNFSLFLLDFTSIFFVVTLDKSNACRGCPSSSIT